MEIAITNIMLMMDLDTLTSIDDMADVPDGKNFPVLSTLLKGKLQKYRESLFPIYDKANSDAMKFRDKHKRCMKVFILASTIAVILALFQLYEPVSQHYWFYFTIAESVAILIAVVTILLDRIVKKYHMKWIVERHRAERCRFLKFFDLLINDEKKYTSELEQIKQISDYSHLEKWSVNRGQMQDIAKSYFQSDSSHYLNDVFSYYLCRRIFVQMNYFLRRHFENREKKELLTETIPIILISIGLFIAFVHIAWEFIERIALVGYSIISVVGILLLFMVIGLPIGAWMLNSLSQISQYRAHTDRYGNLYTALKNCLEKEFLEKSSLQTQKSLELAKMNMREMQNAEILNKENERAYLSELICKQCTGSQIPSLSLNLSHKEIFFGLLCLEDLLEREHDEWIRIMKGAVSL